MKINVTSKNNQVGGFAVHMEVLQEPITGIGTPREVSSSNGYSVEEAARNILTNMDRDRAIVEKELRALGYLK